MPALVMTPDKTKLIDQWVKQTYSYDGSTDTKIEYSASAYANVTLKNCGILGMPYQFNRDADFPRGLVDPEKYPNGNRYIGRLFEDKMMVNAPIVHFEVGKPVFMDKLNKDRSITSYVLDTLGNLEDLIGKDGTSGVLNGKVNRMRYYGFKDDFNNYAHYVNAMCRFTAIKMGIGGKKDATGTSYKAFDIRKFQNKLLASSNNVEKVIYHIPVYCNVQSTNITETGGNSTAESQLASHIKGGSKLARELSFLLNTATTTDMITSNTQKLVNAIDDITGNIRGGNALTGLVKNIAAGGATIVSGANMMMPLIWDDSAFSKSYNISLKLTTPYGHPEAVFNDIYVPLFCILGMVLPRQTSDYGYSSPFIIKAHSKGYFNCDMGMIDSIDIKRGGQMNQDWTVDSLPTNIEINISIKDLYPAVAITQAKNASSFAFAGNTGLVEYLNMMAGLNLSAIRPADNIGAAMHMVMGSIIDLPSEIAHSIGNNIYANIKKAVNDYFS